MKDDHIVGERRTGSKPYAMLGAGELVSTLWKTGSEEVGWHYRFNVFRFASGGQVAQMFTPADLKSRGTAKRKASSEVEAYKAIADFLQKLPR